MPLISAIIPLYNKREHIARAIDSILAQTMSDFEIIVVDDGSTDGGGDVVKDYTDPRVRYFYQANAGPGAARNVGIRLSTGSLLGFLDADDEWLPGFFECMVGWLDEAPECDMAACGHFRGPDRQNMAESYFYKGVREGPWELADNPSLASLAQTVFYLNTWSILCRRQLVEQYGGFYEKDHCTYCEDSYMYTKFALNCSIYRSLEPLVWWHTEASELGDLAQGRPYLPPEPHLTDPDPIREACPPEYRQILERYFAFRTILAVHRLILAGDFRSARFFLRRFPLARELRRDYYHAQYYMLVMTVYRVIASCPEALQAYRFLKRLPRKMIARAMGRAGKSAGQVDEDGQ